MKRLKSFVVLVLCVSMVFALAACGSKPAPTQPATTAAPAPETTAAPESKEEETTEGEKALDFGEYSADKPLTMKLGHMGNEKSATYALSSLFKAKVEEASGGAVIIELYPSGQLGKDGSVFDQIGQGIVEMGINNTPNITGFVPALEILDLSYLFDNYQSVANFLASDVCQDLLGEVSAATDVTMLSLNNMGFRNFANSKKTVTVPDDLKGLIIRVTESNYYQKSIAAMGASPVSMAGGELITALQQGTVDGSDQHNINLWADGIYEFCKNVSLTEHVVHFNGFTINTKLFEGLTPDLQNVIRQCAIDACVERSLAIEDEQTAKQKELEGEGLVFTPVDKAVWKATLDGVYSEFKANHVAAKYLDDILACNK